MFIKKGRPWWLANVAMAMEKGLALAPELVS